MNVTIGAETYHEINYVAWFPEERKILLNYNNGDSIKVDQESLYIGDLVALKYEPIGYESTIFRPFKPVEISEFGRIISGNIPYCTLFNKSDCTSVLCTEFNIREVTYEEANIYSELCSLESLGRVLSTEIYHNTRVYLTEIIEKMKDNLDSLKSIIGAEK